MCRWWPAVLACVVVLSACDRNRSLGGPWVLVTRDTLPESGSSQPRLYHVIAGQRIFVDGLVHNYRVYEGGECIAYKTSRDWWYAACAGKQPVAFSDLDARGIGPDGWRLKSCGLVTVEPASNLDASKRFIFRTETFIGAARLQPPLRPEWWTRPNAIQRIDPVMVDESAVCRE